MKNKIFNNHEIEFLEYEEYVGPVTLMYRPDMTLFSCMGKYLLQSEGRYYSILKVRYDEKMYSINDFVTLYPNVLDF